MPTCRSGSIAFATSSVERPTHACSPSTPSTARSTFSNSLAFLKSGELLSIDSRNCLAPALPEERAVELLREKVLRIVFQQGFFKLRELRLDITREPCEIYLPYWLGFYGDERTVRCRVLDAVRRRIEGAKASAFFEQWLAA